MNTVHLLRLARYRKIRDRLNNYSQNKSHKARRRQIHCFHRYERQIKMAGLAGVLAISGLAISSEISAQCMPEGSEFRVHTHTTDNQRLSDIAIDAVGNFIITWQSEEQDNSVFGIFAQRFFANGTPDGSEFPVNTYTTGQQQRPAIAMSPNGSFVITWDGSQDEDGDGFGVFARRYNAAGIPQGSEFQVNTYTTGDQSFPDIAMDMYGNFVIVWQGFALDPDLTGVSAQKYSADGMPVGSEILVNTYTTENQFQPKVAMDTDGDFVVTWISAFQDGDGHGIYAQRFNSSCIKQGVEFRVNSYTTSSQSWPGVGIDKNGNFAIAWQSYNQDGSQYGIYAQRYNAAGIPQGSEFRVNNYTTGHQIHPVVGIETEGDHFVIAWTSIGQDQSSAAVIAQRYDRLGNSFFDEFIVNTYTTGPQGNSSVAVGFNGEFIITWTSMGSLSSTQDGSGDGIYAQRYICPDPIPTLSQWGLIILGLILAILGFIGLRQKSPNPGFKVLKW